MPLGWAFDQTNEAIYTGAEWGFFGETGKFATDMYEVGSTIPEESREALREQAIEDGTFNDQLAVYLTTGIPDAADGVQDTQEDIENLDLDSIVPSPGDVFPWWAKYAAGGTALLLLLIVLRPYVSIADSAVDTVGGVVG